jgi:DNA-binding response OmpR family regulator
MTGCCPVCGRELASNDAVLLPDNRVVTRGGKTARLSPREWDLFFRLHRGKGQAVSKGQLLDWIYQLENDEPFDKIIDVFVMKVRRKIKPLGMAIITHYGFGFSLAFEGNSRVVKNAEAA